MGKWGNGPGGALPCLPRPHFLPVTSLGPCGKSQPLRLSADEADQRQYEEWLFHTQQLLQMQLKVLEEQIGVHRKSRKALCAKQRTAKKAGREFPEADAEKLKLVTEQQSKIQKQLDQVGVSWGALGGHEQPGVGVPGQGRGAVVLSLASFHRSASSRRSTPT